MTECYSIAANPGVWKAYGKRMAGFNAGLIFSGAARWQEVPA